MIVSFLPLLLGSVNCKRVRRKYRPVCNLLFNNLLVLLWCKFHFYFQQTLSGPKRSVFHTYVGFETVYGVLS